MKQWRTDQFKVKMNDDRKFCVIKGVCGERCWVEEMAPLNTLYCQIGVTGELGQFMYFRQFNCGSSGAKNWSEILLNLLLLLLVGTDVVAFFYIR